MAKTIQGIGRGARSHRANGWTKDCCFVYEVAWKIAENAKRGKRPLCIADALAENGDDPRRICVMDSGSPLRFEQPITPEAIRAKIKEMEITPARWAAMKGGNKDDPTSKLGLKILGYGLIAIARIFGIEGSPIKTHTVHLTLGKAIFGEEWSGP